MSTKAANARTILLLTELDDCEALVRMHFSMLPAHFEQFPLARHFDQAIIEPLPFVDSLESWLKTNKPLLIIIDAQVRKNDGDGAGNGIAASQALEWLDEHADDIPVLIVAMTQVDRVELKVLMRANVDLVSLSREATHAEVDFARSLEAVRLPAGRRLITVEVGDSLAHYSIKRDRRRPVPLRYPYKKKDALQGLVRKVNRYNPYFPGHILNPNWQEEARELGNELFESLIAETIGPHIASLLRPPAMLRSADEFACDLELRFEISVNSDETAQLYCLPFELVNPDDKTENFLCTRIPMARRLRFSDVLDDDPDDKPVLRDHPLRVLFIDAPVAGSVAFRHERTGHLTDAKSFGPLANTSGELNKIRGLARRSRSARDADGPDIVMPTVIGGGSGKPLVGEQLMDRIEEELAKKRYDVVHFAGHSMTLDDDGGTFLLLPDEDRKIRPISIRLFGSWMRGKCPLLVLSSCGGSSLRTAIEAMRNGADAVVGFRWDVDDAVCIEYFKYFYAAFGQKHRSLSQAYHIACRSTEAAAHGTPLWASAIAVVRD